MTIPQWTRKINTGKFLKCNKKADIRISGEHLDMKSVRVSHVRRRSGLHVSPFWLTFIALSYDEIQKIVLPFYSRAWKNPTPQDFN